MRAREIAEPALVARLDDSALSAVRQLVDSGMPGLVVVDATGDPVTVLPASQVIGLLLPRYVRAEPALARVVDEAHADRFADQLAGSTVRELLPHSVPELAAVQADDTLVEVAARIDEWHCPVVAVLDGDELVGVITVHRLLRAVLPG